MAGADGREGIVMTEPRVREAAGGGRTWRQGSWASVANDDAGQISVSPDGLDGSLNGRCRSSGETRTECPSGAPVPASAWW